MNLFRPRNLSGVLFSAIASVGLLRADPRCAVCHPKISASYAKTGMGRSFYKPRTGESARYEHAPSGVTYSMETRDGRYIQKQQRGPDSSEATVDYVMGSGNHVRTFLHRTERGTLVELPLAWYAEGGGTWAMNPGHDREYALAPRQVAYECMFCHNSYPKIPTKHDEPGSEPVYSGELPLGIGCERCHGSGEKHIAAKGAPGTILNPAKLNPERRMEVCMQCHLETTSKPLPHSMLKFGRAPFSYSPAEPLANFELFFDYQAGDPKKDEFEIAHSAYRLRKSKCFLQSKGALTCTTCHDPHDVPRAEAAVVHYNSVCGTCHAHPVNHSVAMTNCIGCHMPKRRAEDVIGAVMTDHYIQRTPPPNLTAPLHEKSDAAPYRGKVTAYYPPSGDPLYLALVQPTVPGNVQPASARPEFYVELGQSRLRSGASAQALTAFRRAVAMEPASPVAALNLGDVLTRMGRTEEATQTLRRALAQTPGDQLLWYQLGIATSDAAAYRQAVKIDPDFADAWNALGETQAGEGDMTSAEQSFRKAVNLHFDFAVALGNLGHVLALRGELNEAAVRLSRAVQLIPQDADARVNYGSVLMALHRNPEARHEFEEALRLRPDFDLARRNLNQLQR